MLSISNLRFPAFIVRYTLIPRHLRPSINLYSSATHFKGLKSKLLTLDNPKCLRLREVHNAKFVLVAVIYGAVIIIIALLIAVSDIF